VTLKCQAKIGLDFWVQHPRLEVQTREEGGGLIKKGTLLPGANAQLRLPCESLRLVG